MIELNSMFDAPQRLNFPKAHNLITDPKELHPIETTDVSAAWILPPIFKEIVAFQASLVAEPPIALGTPDPYMPPSGN